MDFKELREQLTDEQIKDILGQFNVEPVMEDESSITFPTCCHNLEGGSPKLIYYKNTKMANLKNLVTLLLIICLLKISTFFESSNSYILLS